MADGTPIRLTTDSRGIVPIADTFLELDIRILRVIAVLLRESPDCDGGRSVLVLRIDLLMTDCRGLSFALGPVSDDDLLRLATSLPLDILRIGARPGATGATRAGRLTEDRTVVVLRGNEWTDPRDGGRSPDFGRLSVLALRCSGDVRLFFFNLLLTLILLLARLL